MADTKITALTAISTVDPATDVFPIVDTSDTTMAASGTTKKITSNQILGAGGTATLASATITGDLTVDTSTLKVDSANNRVGIGTASPTNALSVAGAIDFKSYVAHTDNFAVYAHTSDGTTVSSFSGYPIGFRIANSEKARIDTSGNFGLGVTPSAWGVAYKAIQQQFGGGFFTSNAGSIGLSGNCYNNGTNWLYASGNPATRYEIGPDAGNHRWFIAGSGTAGNAITFTQAMTLDASGNLLVGTTAAAAGKLDVQAQTGDCTVQFKSNAASTNVVSIIDYVSSYGITRIKKGGSTVWETGVIGSTSATPSYSVFNQSGVGVYLTHGGTSWTATSDERLKDIIEPIGNAVAKVGSLRSVIGKFKTDAEGTRRTFLIAQDVQAVLPEAVDDSNPDQLGVAYSDVIPLLVAAIKELTTRVIALENK